MSSGLGPARSLPVLATTKVDVPGLRPGHVSRAHLATRLDRMTEGPVALVVAPAGSGKSGLLAEWAHSAAGRTVTWLRCDRCDTDPSWLAADLAWSVAARLPQAGAAAAALAGAGSGPDEVIGALVAGIDAHPGPVVTVIDELHAAASADAGRMLANLVPRLPANWHLVIAARSRPAGDEPRLGAEDLRFSDSEAVRLFRETLGLRPAPTLVERLNDQVRGWVMGLCLAAASAGRDRDVDDALRRWSGAHPFVVDYLAEEVLGSLPDALARFVLDSAVLSPFSPELSDVVTGSADSPRHAADVRQRQLFLEDEGGRPGWYRYAPAVTAGLRAHAELRDRSRCCRLLSDAARWSAQNDDPSAAMRYTSRGGQHEMVAGLLGRHGYALIARGGSRDVVDRLAGLPEPLVVAEPELDLVGAQAAWALGEFDTQAAHLQRARRSARRLDDAYRAAGVRRALAVSVPMELARGLTEDTYALAESTIQPAPAGGTNSIRHYGSDPARQYGALSTLAYWAGSLDAAGALATTLLGMEPDRHGRMNALGVAAMVDLLRGDEAGAATLAREAWSLLGETNALRPFQVSWAALALAWTGRDHEAQAAEAALRAVPTVGHWWLSDVHRWIAASEVQLRLGAIADAERLVGLARRAVFGVNQPGTMERLVAVQAERIALRQPDADPLAITARERTVLRLLSGSMSRREIGLELGVSLNTVKTHVRQLYRKLGVASRSAAVERARAIDLI